MRKTHVLLPLLILFMLLVATVSFAQHTVVPWRDNKAGAVSLTFDDSSDTQASVGIPSLDARGFKGTFFVITGDLDRLNFWAPWVAAANSGHELGSHTVNHPDLTHLTVADAQTELQNSKTAIESHIAPKKCVTMAYPYGQYTPTVEGLVQADGYIAARATVCALNSPPYDFYALNSCGPETPLSVDQLKAYADQAVQQGKWLVNLFHGLTGPPYGDWPQADFTAYLDYLTGKNLWVAPFGSVVKYIKERMAASLYVVSQTSDKIVLQLTASALDSTIFFEPLTIRSQVASGWTQVKVQQGSSTQTLTSVTEGSNRVVYYNAVPGGGQITLTHIVAPTPVDSITPAYRAWSLFLNPATYNVFNFANTRVLPAQDILYVPADASSPGWVNGQTGQHGYVIKLGSATGSRFPAVPGLNPSQGVAGVLVFAYDPTLIPPASWWTGTNPTSLAYLANVKAVAAFIPGLGTVGVWAR